MDIGRVCIKIKGREAGRKAVVVDVIDKNFVLIDGLHIKRRRCNILHLMPTNQKLNIKKALSHEELVKILQKEKGV